MPAALYCRISDDREGRALGVARQQEDCEALAARRGWTVAEVFVDNDISAYSGRRRPDYDRMLGGVRAGLYKAVVAWHPDRLHRSPVELEAFIEAIEQAGATVATVTAGDIDLATPTGRMVARIVGAAARHESEHKAERVRRAMAQRALDGLPNGGMRPFGYEKDKLTVRAEEAELIREACRRVLAGEPVRSIRKDWDARVPTTRPGHWTNQTIKQVLTSARVAGLRAHNGEVVGDAVWPAIVERDTWERVRAVLLAPGRGPRGPGPRKHVLVGLAHCALCGARLVSRRRARDAKTNYVCPPSTDRGCGGVGAVTVPFEEEVAERVFATLAGPGLRRALERRANRDGTASVLAERVRADTDRLRALEVAYHVDREVSRAGYLESRSRLESRIAASQRELASADSDAVLARLPADVEGLRAWWSASTVDVRHALLRAVVERVVLQPAARAANRFDPSRVTVEWRA